MHLFLLTASVAFGNERYSQVMAKRKTSISLRKETLRKLKQEARRQRRSVSNIVEIWIEDQFARNGGLKIAASKL